MKLWKRFRKVLIGLLIIALLVLTGLSSYTIYDIYFDPLPETSGSTEVIGLNTPVNIYRDDWGIPYIYADNPDDLFFAQGYVHAQERLWQMELIRLIGYGQISKIANNDPQYQNIDHFVRALGWLEAAEDSWANATPEEKAVLEAYSRGVNAYIKGKSPQDLASEYGLLTLAGRDSSPLGLFGDDREIEPWRPVDSLLWIEFFRWQMSSDLWLELELGQLYSTLDIELASTYRATYPYETRPTVITSEMLPKDDTLIPSEFDALSQEEIDLQIQARSALTAPFIGSITPELLAIIGYYPAISGNAWVVSGKHTNTQQPLLANDLHLPLQIPSPWFEMGLHCVQVDEQCRYNVSGFSVAGLPGIFVGHNDQIAWGITNNETDTQDLYILRLNPQNPLQYEWNGNWIDMQVQTITIQTPNTEVPTIERQIYHTQVGVVLTDMSDYLNSESDVSSDDLYVLALYTAPNTNRILEAILQLNRARNWDEFRSALRQWSFPATNFFYADINGNIGYQMGGAVPIRNEGHHGGVPIGGWKDTYVWQGLVPFDLLPTSFNPSNGIIASANNPIVSPLWEAQVVEELAIRDSVRYRNINVEFSYANEGGYRASRLNELLATIEQHSLDSFGLIQNDNHNTFATKILPFVFALSFEDPFYSEAQAWLKTWNLENHWSEPQAALFEVFWTELCRLIFKDQLLYDNNSLTNTMLVVELLLEDSENPWWDQIQTPQKETRDEILNQSFINAYDYLVETLGENEENWRWGDLHQATLTSKIIGLDNFLNIEAMVDIGPFPLNKGTYEISGSISSLNTTVYPMSKTLIDEPFEPIIAPSYRVIFDLSDFGQSRAMHSSGQSGHPASEHYADMIEPWRTGEYHNLQWDANVIAQSNYKLLELFPSNE